MTKLLEVNIPDVFPDWATTILPAGVYYDQNSQYIYLYKGDRTFPVGLWIESQVNAQWKDVSLAQEEKVMQSRIPVSDIVKIIAIIRTSPENLKIGEIV